MNHRFPMKLIRLTLLSLFLTSAAFASESRPNIVVILADDLGTKARATRRDVVDAALAVLKAEYKLPDGYPELAIFAAESGQKESAPVAASDAAERIVKSLDANADGKLTFDEWKNSPRARANPGKLEPIFAGLDKDGDKTISRDEFAAQWKSR